MKAFLILNEGAGALTTSADGLSSSTVAEAFHSVGIAVELRTASAQTLDETLRAAVAEQPGVIFVGGGDGTLSTAAQWLANTGIALGVLPIGTLNHFARDLGLPLDWRATVVTLAEGACRNVDVGEVNGRVFINNCSIGAYADAVRRRDALRRRRGIGKWWAMILSTIVVLRRLRRLRVQIEVTGNTLSFRTPFVVVANNRYSGRVLDYSLRPRLNDGRLWIYTTRAHRHGAVLRSIWQSLLRRIDQVDALEKMEVAEATIDYTYARLPVAMDGELVDLQPPLRFRIRPAALRVILPRSTLKER